MPDTNPCAWSDLRASPAANLKAFQQIASVNPPSQNPVRFIVRCIFPSDLSGDFFFFFAFLKTTCSHQIRTTTFLMGCLPFVIDITLSSLHIQALLDFI